MTTALPARLAARRRHPSTRTPVRSPLVAERMAGVLANTGARWPEVAAAVLADRGVLGVSPEEYARALGVDPDVLEKAEAGALAPAELPGALLRVVAARL
jgi:ribosome-binding protein aMBF1 (putative translation factor)